MRINEVKQVKVIEENGSLKTCPSEEISFTGSGRNSQEKAEPKQQRRDEVKAIESSPNSSPKRKPRSNHKQKTSPPPSLTEDKDEDLSGIFHYKVEVES